MGLDIITKLRSDLGDLHILLVTARFPMPISDELISRIKSLIAGCDCAVIIVPADKVLNYWHMVYPAYLSLRDTLRGISRFRDVGVGAMTYMAGTDQVKDALSLLSPIGSRDVAVLVMGVGGDAVGAAYRVYEFLARETLDVYVGVGAYKRYNGPWSSIDEFMRALLTSYLRGYT